MRRTFRVLALLMVMACTAHAGWIPNGVTDPPPPPTNSETGTQGVMPNGVTAEIALNVLGGLLSLF